MADRMMLAQAIAAAAALLLSSGSAAQALTDPTRPPLELIMGAAAGAADGPAPRTPLQSILMSTARKGAIINGQYVPLGGTYGNARLVGISATEVTLKSDGTVEVLQLNPPTENTSVASRAEGKPEKTVKRP
ncbi:MAG: hypothetical protein EPO19_07310 [Betaproteobacteria bacterium]|nr:MAG: hypothetical protein EPO19_07310 [Betaproteobacteria bacterium]